MVDKISNNGVGASAAVLRAATGMSELELQSQRLVMLHLERQQRQQQQMQHQEATDSVATLQRNLRRNSSQDNLAFATAVPASSPDAVMTREAMNEQLNREHYRVVKILTNEEFPALERW